MGSRKDLIKRSLGITEYPWSSDDDLEEATLTVEESGHRRPPVEPLSNMVDAPRPSGLPPQPQMPQQLPQQQLHHMQQQHQQQSYPQQHQQTQHQQPQHQHQLNEQQQHATARRNQARMDRDLFWSILNSPHRIPIHASRSRSSDVPVSYVSRVNHVPAPELRERAERPAAADIQRILAFKRLTRNLGSLRHRGHIAGVIPVTRVNPGVIVPSEANSGIRISRHLPIRRFVRSGTSGLLTSRSGQSHAPPSESSESRRSRSRTARARDSEHRASPTQHARTHASEDEINNNPLPPPADPEVLNDIIEEQDVQLEGEIDADVPSDHLSPNVTLEEEIVAIDLDNSDVQVVADEEENHDTSASASAPDDGPAATAQTDGPFRTDYIRPAEDTAVASTSGTTSDLDPQPNQGVKRKRKDSEDNLEPYSVKEFNQNLLRLLECPVCLEWMEPPMSQCRRGHLVCGRCRARLASCPVCRTTFSSVRNRAMEGVAELLRYPCRHGCGREVRLRRRAPHEASCAARKYHCPAPLCADDQPLPRSQLAVHFQTPQGSSSCGDLLGRSSSQPVDVSSHPVETSPRLVDAALQPVEGSLNSSGRTIRPAEDEQDLLSPEREYVIFSRDLPPHFRRLLQTQADISSSMEAARVRPINNPNEPSLPGENQPQHYNEQSRLPPQYQLLGQFLQQPYGAGPYFGVIRGNTLIPTNPGFLQEYYSSHHYGGEQRLPPQFEGQPPRDRTPYLSALREYALNIADEFSLQEGNRVDEQSPVNSQNSTQTPNNVYGDSDAGVHNSALSQNISNEETEHFAQPPLQEEDVAAVYHRAGMNVLGALQESALNTADERSHLTMMKIGPRHKFSMKVNSEQHDNWIILALEEYFHLRVDVDIRTWGVVVYVSYIGPKCDAKNYTYEVTIDGQHNQRKLAYARTTHSDLESSSLNVSRQDCFHLTLDQALNFIRFKNKHCDAEKFLDFNVEISKVEQSATPRDESDS